MHGDMSQPQREAVIRRLRNGQVEIVVATDVAARGLDVDRIGWVVNYDMPNDVESYVHRIGRTGRAGRVGRAVLFVTPRQQRMKREIEQYTGQRIEPMKMPTEADVASRRVALFKERILKTLQDAELDLYLSLVEELVEESGRDMAEIAAAAAHLAGRDRPLEVALEPEPEQLMRTSGDMIRMFIDVGRNSNVGPADIVGAIANEAGVPGKAIGAIDVHDRFTMVDLPAEYLGQVLQRMKGTRIRNQNANIRVAGEMTQNKPAGARKVKGKARPATGKAVRKGGQRPPKRGR
jgi:ATP-dependent RNA helicase DeaD